MALRATVTALSFELLLSGCNVVLDIAVPNRENGAESAETGPSEGSTIADASVTDAPTSDAGSAVDQDATVADGAVPGVGLDGSEASASEAGGDGGPSGVVSIDVPDLPGVQFGNWGFHPPSLLIEDAGESSLRVADLRVRPGGQVVALIGDPLSGGCESFCSDHDAVLQLAAGAPTLDPMFGSGGIATLPMAFGGGGGVLVGDGSTFANLTVFSTAMGGQLLLQPDGKVLVVGTCSADVVTGVFYACVERLDAHGSADQTFGHGGISVVYQSGIGSSTGVGIALEGSGRIDVLADFAQPGSNGPQYAVARIQPDGGLDLGFASGGVATLSGSLPRAIAVQRSGRILVLGSQFQTDGARAMVLGALGPAGAVDPTFDSDASVALDFAGTFPVDAGALPLEEPASLHVMDDESVFAMGTVGLVSGTRQSVGLAKFTRDGAPDPTFGAGGRVRIASSMDSLSAFSLVPFEGHLFVAAGAIPWPETSDALPLLVKLDARGALEPSYAQGGVLRLPFALPLASTSPTASEPYALAAGTSAIYVGAGVLLAGSIHDGIVIAEPPEN